MVIKAESIQIDAINCLEGGGEGKLFATILIAGNGAAFSSGAEFSRVDEWTIFYVAPFKDQSAAGKFAHFNCCSSNIPHMCTMMQIHNGCQLWSTVRACRIARHLMHRKKILKPAPALIFREGRIKMDLSPFARSPSITATSIVCEPSGPMFVNLTRLLAQR